MQNKISILIPCYNVQEYIEQCLNSIINQTYSNIEIICINDGSTDKTLSILRQYIVKDARIKLFDQANKGLSETRTLGIQYASGDYVVFVDGDDWLAENCLAIVLKNQNNYDLICFSYTREFVNQSIPKRLGINGEYTASDLQRRIVGPIDNETSNVENLDALVTVWGKLYKTEKIKNIRFPEVSEIGTWEDGLFNLNVLENCDEVLIIDEPLYHYRKDNAQSFTSLAKKDLYKKWLIKFQMISDLVKHKNWDYQKALQNRIAISFLGLALTEMNSSESLRTKNKNLSQIISEPVYKNALQQLELKNLPLQWKLFYGFAKSNFSIGVLFLTKTIQLIQKIKNL